MQHVICINPLSIAFLLSCGMQIYAMDVYFDSLAQESERPSMPFFDDSDLHSSSITAQDRRKGPVEELECNGFFYNPNVCSVTPIRQVQPKKSKPVKLIPLPEGHASRKAKARANDPFKIKISNQSEAPCNVQLPFYDPYPLPAFVVKQNEDYVAYVVKPKSQILIRYLNNVYTLRMALSNLGNGRELSELVLEHQGKCCKGFIPNPVVMQATTTLHTTIFLNGQTEDGTPVVLLRDANEVAPAHVPRVIANDNNQPKVIKEPVQECPICFEDLKQNDPNVEKYCKVCTGKMHASCFASVREKFKQCPTCGLEISH